MEATTPRNRRARLFENLADDLRAASLEFLGTAFFLLIALGGVQSAAVDSGDGVGKTLYTATSLGLSLLVSAWLFYRVTGGLFNPNVSLALFLVGSIGPIRFILYCLAQLLGAIAGAALVRGLTPEPYLVNTFLQNNTSKVQGVFIEAFTTAALVLAVLMLAAEKHEATPFAPIGIGLTLFACSLFSLYYTNAGMNTARSFGPAVVSGFPYSDQWVYWVGPFIGSLLAVAIYTFLKHYRYWTLNPDQTTSEAEKSPDDPVNTIKATLSKTDDNTVRSNSLSEKGGKRSTDTKRFGSTSGDDRKRPNDSAV